MMDLKKLNQKIGEYRSIIALILVITFGLLFIFRPYINFQLEVELMKGICGNVSCMQIIRGNS